MTFTEAAIEVLRREGKPLHFKKITELAIRENLLDHVGKIPEETMADQLAAHCRLPRTERRVLPVQQGTFGLMEWGLDEDPAGLEDLVPPPEDGGLSYRGRERHPVPSRDLARASGRGEGRPRRREEEERRGRRFPPPAEVAYEILAGAGKPLALVDIAAQGAERLLMPDAFVRDTASLLAALSEDNRRRDTAGKTALFDIQGETVNLAAPPEPGERPSPVAPLRAPVTAGELRRAALAALRRRLREGEPAEVEWIVARLLDKLGFRELKVAGRAREHAIYTARRRMGLAEVRHGIRILRGGSDAGRREVSDLRRDLGHHGGQIGIIVSAGEAAREARTEAAAPGQLPVVLLCGEALAEALADAGIGVQPVVVPEVDDAFFRAAAEAGEKEERARRARRDERRERPRTPEAARERAEGEPEAEAEAEAGPLEVERAPAVEVAALAPVDLAEELEEGEDEEVEGEVEEGDVVEVELGTGGAASSAAEPGADRRRRRRRRRRRGGRGRGREGTAPAPGAAAAASGAPGGAEAPPGAGPAPEGAAAPAPAPAAEPAPEPPPPTPGDGS